MNTGTEIWNSTLDVLKNQLTATTIRAWFEDVYAVSFQGDTLVLCSPSDYKREIIATRYAVPVEKALLELFSQEIHIKMIGPAEAESYKDGDPNANFMPGTENYTFDTFVVGSSNRFAYNAAKKISESPGRSYNPLFIYGASGLGKTHLLYAIAHAIHQKEPSWRIRYVKSETFVNELIQNLRSQETYMEAFRKKYREVDVFLMDDVQFMAGKNASEEELFHTFNTLFEGRKQIVFTSDRPPQEMLRLEERLKTRFDWGLSVDIQPPDYETRVGIIKNKAIAKGINLPDPVLQYVAENITANVRQIEGTVSKLLAMQDLMGQDVNIPNVIRAVQDILKSKTEFMPSPDLIINEVAQFFEIDPNDMRGQSQNKQISAARNIAMYLIREMDQLPLQQVGALFSNRHYSTVISSLKRVETLLSEDPNMGEIIRDLKSTINSKFD